MTHSPVRVAYSRCASYSDRNLLRDAIRQVLAVQIEDFPGGVSGKKIMLKPNLLAWRHEEDVACVHPAFLVESALPVVSQVTVLAGNYGVSFEEAEEIKKDPSRQKEILPVVKPVLEKMASIINRHIAGRDVSEVYLVGGTCCLKDMEKVIARETGKTVCKPANPFLVTPLGIALNCAAGKGGA